MPCKDFTTEEIIEICCDIARRDNIRLQQLPGKTKNPFRRSASTVQTSPKPPRSAIARRLSLVNGIPAAANEKSDLKDKRRLSVDSSLQSMKVQQRADKSLNVPGLRGRDIVAMAILVNSDGVPMRTYTEHQNIPSEEVDAADKIFIARVPVQNDSQSSDADNNNIDKKGSHKLLAESLHDIDLKQTQKLTKRVDKILIRLHTTDLNTALSFLKVERYADVRNEIKTEMLAFASKELKLVS